MASATMPTRIYSSGVFIPHSPLLQALARLGEGDERRKRHQGHNNDNQVKHTDPPRETASPQYSPHLYSSLQYIQRQHFLALPPPRQGAAPLLSETAAPSRPGDEMQRADVGTQARRTQARPSKQA